MDWFDFGESSSHESLSNNLKPDWDIIQQPTEWTADENKIFQNALAEFQPDSPCFYENIVSRIPWKSVDEIKMHYQTMSEDVVDCIPIENDNQAKPQGQNLQEVIITSESSSAPPKEVKKNISQQRCRGTPWTPEEHQLFLMGLNKFGKGDWKSISSSYVITKTPIQVASHAQKYFRRQNSSTPMDKRRWSIHDIQTVKPHSRTSMYRQNINNYLRRKDDNLLPFPSSNYGLINPILRKTYNNGLGQFGNVSDDQLKLTSSINCTLPVMNNRMVYYGPEAYPLMNQNENQVPQPHTLMFRNENESSRTYPLVNQSECFGTYPLQNQNQFSCTYPLINQSECFSTYPLQNQNQCSGSCSMVYLNQNQVIEAYPLMNPNEGLGTYSSINQNDCFVTLPLLNRNQLSGACSTLNQNENYNQNQVVEAYPLMNQNDGFGTYPLINQNDCFGTYPLLNQNQFSGACSTLNQNQVSEAFSMSYDYENLCSITDVQNCIIFPMNTELPVVNNQEKNQACDAYMPYVLPFNANK